MKFVCMGFIEPNKMTSMPPGEAERMMNVCFDYDDELRRGGHFLGGEALQAANHAVTLRLRDGSVDVCDGPYAETKEMLGGILLMEARDLSHAIALMSQHPGLKMGPFEIRPADEQINALLAQRDAAFKAQTPALPASTPQGTDMFAKPQAEHQWLEQFVGEWDYVSECQMAEGQTTQTHGTASCRTLGGIWLIFESFWASAEGGSHSTMITLGYDPLLKKFVGTFAGSMMANLWHYVGELQDGKRLPLLSEGPKFDGSGRGNYRDTFEPIDKDTWLFSGELQGDDGQWVKFMSTKHTRKRG